MNCCHDAASKASSNAALKEGDPRCARILSYREVDVFVGEDLLIGDFP